MVKNIKIWVGGNGDKKEETYILSSVKEISCKSNVEEVTNKYVNKHFGKKTCYR